jgi:hypothetical protein
MLKYKDNDSYRQRAWYHETKTQSKQDQGHTFSLAAVRMIYVSAPMEAFVLGIIVMVVRAPVDLFTNG